ncbi:amidase family protein [Gammaproteobacteria bacterium]|nr:amidase family protein [Gammaproteobacteria bacterium]
MPIQNAPLVERMKLAGAIPLAMTNLPEFGLRIHTDKPLRGLTRNPWDSVLTGGGSRRRRRSAGYGHVTRWSG